MAATSYGVNHDLAVKLWSKKLFTEALKATYFSRFMSKGTGNIVQIKDETSKGAGDKITFGLRMQLTGDGVQGDGTLEGNEESLTTYADAVYIDQLRHAVRSAGKMSEQRVPFSVREEAKDGLRDWWQDRLDTWFFNQLAGNTATGLGTKFTGNQAALAPDSTHVIRGGGVATDELLVSSGTFNLNLIDKCVEKAKTLTVPLRPVKVGGKDKFVMFLHPYQVYDMRTTTSDGQWLDIQKACSMGKGTDNPIYDGSLGEYNGVILHESTRIPLGVNSTTSATVANTRRAVFCGAQAAVMAYGKDDSGEMSWTEELFDYGNQLGVSAGMIAGLKKTRFNSLDFGTIAVPTYAAAH
jgi:N4-gp56 family major capsid protein